MKFFAIVTVLALISASTFASTDDNFDFLDQDINELQLLVQEFDENADIDFIFGALIGKIAGGVAAKAGAKAAGGLASKAAGKVAGGLAGKVAGGIGSKVGKVAGGIGSKLGGSGGSPVLNKIGKIADTTSKVAGAVSSVSDAIKSVKDLKGSKKKGRQQQPDPQAPPQEFDEETLELLKLGNFFRKVGHVVSNVAGVAEKVAGVAGALPGGREVEDIEFLNFDDIEFAAEKVNKTAIKERVREAWEKIKPVPKTREVIKNTTKAILDVAKAAKNKYALKTNGTSTFNEEFELQLLALEIEQNSIEAFKLGNFFKKIGQVIGQIGDTASKFSGGAGVVTDLRVVEAEEESYINY